MAPSSGHVLVPMAMRMFRHLSKKTSSLIRAKLSSLQPVKLDLIPIRVRNVPRQPIHPAAFLRQSRGRWFTTASASLYQFTSASRSGIKYDRASLPKSVIGGAVTRWTTRTPFASTLRPNLTGGALPRTAGGYSTGAGRVGGLRHFSHTPTAPAEVLNNVSAAVRAFWVSGQRAAYDGCDPLSGKQRFKTVSKLEDQVSRKIQSMPPRTVGSHVDFHLSPTVTALSRLGMVQNLAAPASMQTLNAEGLLDMLSVDFAHALKDLAAVLQDLKRLSVLGDLPISTTPGTSVIRVSFPGCDLKSVERLCDEMGVQRGIIRQDEGHVPDEPSLLFPFAPTGSQSAISECMTEKRLDQEVMRDQIDWHKMMESTRTNTSTGFSRCSDAGHELEAGSHSGGDTWPSSALGYCSLDASSQDDPDADAYFEPARDREGETTRTRSASDFEGLEGIYRFLELCDTARR